ncbi:hypothetical protein [Jannaschia sp. R86511]|uniref:hypothetical protein n=1 Tax=Jannaschia sp. R86511 TaxID=3093853 RepID=UPI0036D23535
MSQAPTPASVPSRPPVGGEDPRAEHLADVLAAAVLATPGVVGLHGGRFGEIGTYLPGRRVVGVRVSPGPGPDTGSGLGRGPGSVELHVVVEPWSLPGVGETVREAATPLAGGLDVFVVVADVVDPVQQAAERAAADEAVTTPAPNEPDRSAGREENAS